MNNIPIASVMVALSVILVLRILYKAWRARQDDPTIRRRPAKSSSSQVAPSPLSPPPVPQKPAEPPAPVLASSPPPRVMRDSIASIHDDAPTSRSTPEAGRSRIFGNKPAGSGIWDAGYVTAASQAQKAKTEPTPPPFEEMELGDGSDLVFGPVTTTLASMLPESDDRRRELTRTLQNAGYYGRHAWHNLASIRYLGIFLPVIFCCLMLVFGPERLETLLISAIVFLPLVGWALPTLIVRGKADKRLKEISNGMPDMLDLLNMCVSQGMTVPRALGRVGGDLEPVYPALAKELKIVTEQSRIGSIDQALTGFSQRVDVPEVHSFTSLIIQTDRMGTSMSEALVDYSDSMRETMRQRTDQKAGAATFKLLFPTVLCLLPAVYLFLLGPAVIQLSDFYTGRGREVLQTGNRGQNAQTGQANNRQ